MPASSVWESLGRSLSPVEDRPRVAADLESATYTTRSGAAYVVVHNPHSQTYARLDPREFELLCLMDGRHTVKELVIAYYQRHGVLALARVAGLVRLLRQQGFLVEGSMDAYATLAGRLRNDQHLPSAAVATHSVDRAFGAWYGLWGRLFFTRGWLFVGLALGVIGPALVVIELVRERYTLYSVGGSAVLAIVLLAVLALIALAIHEVGHGMAVKHAGRRVREAGVRLYFGLPAAYVDTTDIWMAPPASRLLTAFAGPWTGLVLGGLCAIGATLIGPGNLGTFLFTAAFVFLVDNLFNFNPLLELDGYYMLIDFLDRPLLRPRALAFVRGPLWSRILARQPLSGDERLLAAFGLGSVGYALFALFLALRAWQALLVPLINSSLTSENLLVQFGGLIVLAAVVIPVVAAALVLVRRGVRLARDWLAWVSWRVAERRHREALSALRAVPLWSEVPPARLLELARAMHSEDVAPGQEVIRQGDVGDNFYLIARGAFEVLVDDRAEVRLGPGDFFGERALLHRSPRTATVVATQAGRAFVLARDDFESLLATDLAARARVEAALQYRDEVSQMPLFRDLPPAELDVLLARFEPVAAAAGEVIIRHGEPGERFYVVRSGMVEVTRRGAALTRLGPGEAFGEIALLLNVPRTATVVAIEPTQLLALNATDFRDVLGGYLGRAGELERLSHLRLLTHKRLDEVV